MNFIILKPEPYLLFESKDAIFGSEKTREIEINEGKKYQLGAVNLIMTNPKQKKDTLASILNNNEIVRKEKTLQFSLFLIAGKLPLHDLIETAKTSNHVNKPTLIESLEYATKSRRYNR